MNRLDFCGLLLEAKNKSGINTSDLSFAIKMQWSTLRRFEKGTHSFGMKKAIEYLDIVHGKICLMQNKKKEIISDYNKLIEWEVRERSKTYTQRSLAEKVGCSYVNLANIESGKSVMSVDIFLKIVDALGFAVDIKTTGN